MRAALEAGEAVIAPTVLDGWGPEMPPFHYVVYDEAGIVHIDSTQFTAPRDSQNLLYYYRSYDDQTIRVMDLRRFDLNAKEVKKLGTTSIQPIVDMSSSAK